LTSLNDKIPATETYWGYLRRKLNSLSPPQWKTKVGTRTNSIRTKVPSVAFENIETASILVLHICMFCWANGRVGNCGIIVYHARKWSKQMR
jgi:hypothetical protein